MHDQPHPAVRDAARFTEAIERVQQSRPPRKDKRRGRKKGRRKR